MSGERTDNSISGPLALAGLNLVAILPVSRLDQSSINGLPHFGANPVDQQTLLLVGNSGPAFWAACRAQANKSDALPDSWQGPQPDPWQNRAVTTDPVDNFSVRETLYVLQAQLAPASFQLLYPVLPEADLPPCNISLQALGALVGWHQRSPLGIGIHPESGLWFAYRSLVLLDLDETAASTALGVELAAQCVIQPDTSVCMQCETLDCINACPGEALVLNSQPDMQRCIDFRIGNNSDCADKCLARNACPVAAGLRYTAEQITYHYSISLASILRWQALK